jgi:chemotaxis protein histidine kinase CheA
LREFLNRYPDSFYAPDARALLDLLEREAREKANDDRAKSERAVAQASTQEQDLAAKLAAAEAEREKLTKELTQQADNRAEALKAEIAQLQQQAAQAKATAEAAVQKAEDAKKAAEGSAEVASAAPAPPPSAAGDLSLDQRALVAPIEAELRRVGCYAGGDDDWGAPSVRLGVAEFGRYAKLIPPTLPDDGLLSALKGQSDRVCPLECSARETAVNGQCVAKVCPRGEILGRNGQCFEPVARAPPAAATRQVEYPRPAANREPRAVAARKAGRPASHGGSASRCFTFNNNQYCE